MPHRARALSRSRLPSRSAEHAEPQHRFQEPARPMAYEPQPCGGPLRSSSDTSVRLRLGEWMDQLSGFEFGRIKNHGFAGLTELVDVVALDVLILDVENSGLLPLTERTEFHVANDGLELRLVQMIGKLALVEAADRGHRLSQDLHFGIREWRPKAERIGAGRGS